MERVLITGIDGFTGRYLAQELRNAGFEVSGTSLVQPAESEFNTYACNMLDPDRVRAVVAAVKPHVVCHLAAIAFVAHGDADTMYRTNIVGTRNLLASLAEAEEIPRTVLLASSSNIYGNADVDSVHEGVKPSPMNDYAVTKLAMEYMAMLWVDRIPLTFVRPFNYTGVGQSKLFLIPKIVDHFRRKVPYIELGNLDVIRDFSDVRTVVHCYRRLIEVAPDKDLRGEAFNTCSGKGHSLQDILGSMRRISGHELEVRVNPAFVRSNDVKKLVGTRAKLEAAIGAVKDISLDETLSWMFHASFEAGSGVTKT